MADNKLEESNNIIDTLNLSVDDQLTPPESTGPRNIWDYWVMPDSPPRETQIEVLDRLAALPASAKYILCEMPVGTGKSPIAITYAGFLGHGTLGTSYILTPQRILQRQYEESFGSGLIHSVYGKANYMCNEKIGLDCDVASDVKPKCANCPSKKAFADMQHMPHVVLNYKLALLYSELFPDESTEFPIRDLMVFDECHTLENQLVNHRAISVTKKRCEEMKIKWIKPDNLEHAHEWLKEEYYPAVDARYFELDRTVKEIDNKYEFGPGGLLPSEINMKREFKRITRHRNLVKRMAAKQLEFVERSYVLMRDKNMFQFKEIYGSNLFSHILEPKANRFLFMSATILNQDEFCRDLGIPKEETAVISVTSEFHKDNRPVYFMPTSRMSYGWNKPDKAALRDKMAKKVISLCELHAEDSGIVHTGSFLIAKWLIGELEGKIPHEIVTHKPEDGLGRDDIIEEFTDNKGEKPMLLISPSITEGLDLKDDSARFAIFVKVPYPFLGDEWVKRRLELSEEWYTRQAMINMIQGGGRIVRTPEDWGNTYILDESFSNLWYRFKPFAPEWWKEAFSKIK